MDNMPKDPKYMNNTVKFFGVEQDRTKGRKPMSYEQKLQKFIGAQ